ncbi:energy transducer TonB family protein, partial [Plastoroseomonas arctica]
PAPPAVAAPGPSTAPTPAATPGTNLTPNYVSLLLAALERHKRYPSSARARRAQGVAILRFHLARDGRLLDWHIDRTSGDLELDDAVADMIRSASPLPAPPAEVVGDRLELVVPVRFTLR